MLPIYQCAFCQHFEGSQVVPEQGGSSRWKVLDRCPAFPDGIPLEILDGRWNHRRPYPGDHGIGFAPKDADAERMHQLSFIQPAETRQDG